MASVGASDGVTFGGLTVNGNSEFEGNINFTGDLLKDGELYESGAFKKNDAGEAYFDSANVGIGTNDPASKLHVKDSSAIMILETTTVKKTVGQVTFRFEIQKQIMNLLGWEMETVEIRRFMPI